MRGRNAPMTRDGARAIDVGAVLLLALAGWGAAHSYRGIEHDAILYALQALRIDIAPALSGDMFLRDGSQAAYTVFPAGLAALFGGLGMATGAKIFVAGAQVLWLIGAWTLLRRFATTPMAAALMLLSVAALDPNYGVRELFGFGEGVATPRVLVEALTMFAFAAVLGGRIVVAAALFLAAAALHPIMAVAGAGVVAFHLALADRRWWIAILGGLAALGALGALDLGPFGRLFARIDPEWRAALTDRNFYLFPSLWRGSDWAALLADFFALIAAAAVARDRPLERRVYLAAALGLGAGVGATVLGVEVMENLFLLQAQPSRIFWLTHMIALAAVARLALSLLPASEGRNPALRAWTALVLVALALSDLNVLAETVASGALLVLSLIAAFRRRGGDAGHGPLWRGAAILIFGAAAALAGFVFWIAAQRYGAVAETVPEALTAPAVLMVSPAICLALVFAFRALGPGFGLVALALAGAFAVLSLSAWDRRDDWSRYVESGDWSALTDRIGPEEEVFWQPKGGAKPVWIGLQRRSHISATQGAGLVFVRETAMVYHARRRAMAPIQPGLGMEYNIRLRLPPRPVSPEAAVRAICADEDGPDVLILLDAPGFAPSFRWPLPAPFTELYGRDPDRTIEAREDLETERIEAVHLMRCDALTG